MPDTVHVVLTDYGEFGWGISSPQVPGFIGGRDTAEVLTRDMGELLALAGIEKGSTTLSIHHEKHLVMSTGDEIIIRVAKDEKYERRFELAQRFLAGISVVEQLSSMLEAPQRSTGEVLFICTEQDDTIGWVAEQLEREDVACLVLEESPERIRTQLFGVGDHPSNERWRELKEFDWTEQTTLGDIMLAQDSGQIGNRELVGC